jgi:rubrerythrin
MTATHVVNVTGEFEDYEDEDGRTQERVKSEQENFIKWTCEDCGHTERENPEDETEME